MPYRPIKHKLWICFLKTLGLECIDSTKGHHEKWNYPPGHPKRLSQPITFRNHKKDIPALHIATNLKTLNLAWDEMEKAMEENC